MNAKLSPRHRPSPPTPPRRVVVAGLGLMSPLGHGSWATFRALLAGATVADRLANLEPETDPLPLAQAVGGVSLARQTPDDPACDLAERAAREAAAEAGVPLAGLPTWLGTSKGAVTAWTRAADAFYGGAGGAPGTVPPDRAACVALGPHGFLTHHLATRTGVSVRGHAVAACASGLVALGQAFRTLRQTQGDTPAHALVVSSESAMLPAFVHSYRRLGVLAPTTQAGYRARPLDQARGGFVLGEAGGAVLLRALPPGVAPQPGQTELLDTALATDPHDLIRSDPNMTPLRRVAQQLADTAGEPFAAVHPHAPGTAEHDDREAAVLAHVLGQVQGPPTVYAVKGALGHTLGASGMVSLVCAALCARTRKRPPMPWLQHPVDCAGLDATPHATPLGTGPHAVFAAGLGGPVAGACLHRVTG